MTSKYHTSSNSFDLGVKLKHLEEKICLASYVVTMSCACECKKQENKKAKLPKLKNKHCLKICSIIDNNIINSTHNKKPRQLANNICLVSFRAYQIIVLVLNGP